MRCKTIAKIVVGVLVVGVGLGYAAFKDDIAALWDKLHVKIAEYPQPKKTVWLDQGISKEKLSWFYHADQGTRTFGFPYEWFMALEQPTIPWLISTRSTTSARPPISTAMASFRTRSSRARRRFRSASQRAVRCWTPRARRGKPAHQGGHERNRPDLRGLSHRPLHLQGHGRRHRRRTGAHQSLHDEAGHGRLAVADALLCPARFNRFAEHILGPDSTVADRETLKYQLDQVLKQYERSPGAGRARRFPEHPGRLRTAGRAQPDRQPGVFNRPEEAGKLRGLLRAGALSRASGTRRGSTGCSITAPSCSRWCAMPAKPLGVSAELNLTDPSKGLYKSSVDVEPLYEMEQMISRRRPPNAKDGLFRPEIAEMAERYSAADRPEAGGAGRRTLQDPLPGMSPAAGLERGVLRFRQQGLVDEEPGRRAGPEARKHPDLAYRHRSRPGGGYGEPNGRGSRTSRHQEQQLRIRARRGGPENRQLRLRPEEAAGERQQTRKKIDGYMPNHLRGELAYKVRPLNGVWATPPYLHNGSVPTVEALLGPPKDRPKKFYLGNREYDPVNLGYKIRQVRPTGLNSTPRFAETANTGHEFRKDYSKEKEIKGVIGPALSPGRPKGTDRIPQDAVGAFDARRSLDPRAGMSGPRHRGDRIVPTQLTASALCAVLAGMIASE